MKVIDVVVVSEYKLRVTFDDDVTGVIDMQSFIDNGIFTVLQNKEVFNKVYTTGYSIAWSDELEIDAIAIYAEIQHKTPNEILSSKFNYASN